jgi:hypothetical protein
LAAQTAPFFESFGPPVIAVTNTRRQAVSPVSWPILLGTGSQLVVAARPRNLVYFANLSATATALICPAQDGNNNPLAAGGPGSIPIPPGGGLPIEGTWSAWNGSATAPNTPFTVLEFFVGGISGSVGFAGSGSAPITTLLSNDGGWLIVATAAAWPTSSVSLPAGSLWSNGALATVVPGVTPNPSAPPVFFGNITAAALLALGGGNLPLTNPGPGSGQLYNQGGVIAIA